MNNHSQNNSSLVNRLVENNAGLIKENKQLAESNAELLEALKLARKYRSLNLPESVLKTIDEAINKASLTK